VTDTDPGADDTDARVLPCEPIREDEASADTAAAINQFLQCAAERLADHPVNRDRAARGLLAANGILTRGAGEMPRVLSLVRQLGIRAAVVCGEKTIRGVGRLLGYDVISDPRFTSLPDTDLAAKVEAARAALSNHDLVVLHIKAPDICSHDRDADGKRLATERIDAALAPLLGDDLVVGISCDHSTNSNTGRHCGDPVPSILRTPGGRVDSCDVYDEQSCARGGLGRLTATAFFSCLLDGMGGRSTYRPDAAEFIGS
jgi:2,3-bisphosphoglycerate-independent phosphoglycerate mutase